MEVILLGSQMAYRLVTLQERKVVATMPTIPSLNMAQNTWQSFKTSMFSLLTEADFEDVDIA